ncbi:MAG TPA: hypothetical protein VMT67_11405 [Terriglobales bacterium]|nr:hypothetical protein [Terriglobales bacterium]
MKKIAFGLLLTLFSTIACSATFLPVQLLNPTGSNSGQAIVSTGASSAPAWGGIGVNGISAIAANTVLANATGSSASPTAFAMPSCSTSTNILQYTTSTGFTCNTSAWTAGNAASFSTLTATGQTSLGGAAGAEAFRAVTTASAVNWIQASGATTGSGPSISAQGSDANISLGITAKGSANIFFNTGGGSQVLVTHTASSTRQLTLTGSNGGNPTIGTTAGNVSFSSAIAPSTTAGIIGTTLADNANAGSVGEYVTSSVTSVGMTSASIVNLTSISLTAGDWDVGGNVICTGASSATISSLTTAINTTSATFPASPFFSVFNGLSYAANSSVSQQPAVQRESLSSTTTVYLVTQLVWTTGTASCSGFIRARRVR